MSALLSMVKGYIWPTERQIGDFDNSSVTPASVSASQKATTLVCAHCHAQLNNCFRSQIDHDKEISAEVWSVSILVHKSKYKIVDIFSHHTILIFEGFKTNGKFWRKAHLMGPGSFDRIEVLQDCFSGHSNIGQVELTKERYSVFDVSKFKIYRQTWTTSREKIEQLLTQIMWEQQHPEATPFRFLGEKSLVAVTKEFLDTRHPELLEVEKADPNKFRKLCLLVKDKNLLENFDKWYSKNRSSFVIIYKICIATALIATIIAAPIFTVGIRGPNASEVAKFVLSYERAAVRSMHVLALGTGSVVYDVCSKGRKYEALVKEVKENDDQLRFIEGRAKITAATSQNCFNWARKSLRAIDVELPEKRLEMLIAIPETYLPIEEKDTCLET